MASQSQSRAAQSGEQTLGDDELLRITLDGFRNGLAGLRLMIALLCKRKSCSRSLHVSHFAWWREVSNFPARILQVPFKWKIDVVHHRVE
jgi:hypothetical protein